MQYQARLDRLRALPTVTPGGAEEEAALGRFIDFFSDLTPEAVAAKVAEVYAPDAYLNDTLKEVSGVEQIREYFMETAQAVHQCRVEVQDWARSEGNYYLRWVMIVRFKKLRKGRETRSIGMSHLRFDAGGRVVLHQDYWDAASGLFEHVPVIGNLIRMIKRRL